MINHLKLKVVKQPKLATSLALLVAVAILLVFDAYTSAYLLFLVVLFAFMYICIKIFILIVETHDEILRMNHELRNRVENIKARFGKETRRLESRNKKQLERVGLQLYRQIEAKIALDKIVKLNKPVVGLGGWAFSADSLFEIVKIILAEKPNLVLELGGGKSTVYIAAALKKNGKGKVISIDHKNEYLMQTKQELEAQGLVTYTDLRHRKLGLNGISGKNKWYLLTKEDIQMKYNLLVIDGPPESTQKHARYPAMPALNDSIKAGGVIILDDMDRQDEQEIVRRWVHEYSSYELKVIETERRLGVLKKLRT